MPVVIALIIVIFLVFIGWTWHNLGEIDKTKKTATIAIATIILGIVTFIVFNISQNGISYKSQEQMEVVRNVLVILFTFVNGLIVMPPISKVFGKIFDKQIDKDKAQKRLIVILIIFIVILFFECSYMKSIQQEIIRIYTEASLK
ncbi:MAG: hypothetical protein IKF38_06645 [Clostridia bacterium]|nr:hypothetical protein [Clostridia bacterium]